MAIRDIKDEYDYIANQGRQDMESWYKLKVSEVQGNANRALMESNYQRDEVKRMRDNIGDLRGKLADLEAKNAQLEKEVQNLNYQVRLPKILICYRFRNNRLYHYSSTTTNANTSRRLTSAIPRCVA